MIPRQMTIRPANIAQLQETFAKAAAQGERIAEIDVGAMNRVIDHAAEDMTVTVEAGMLLADLQRHLAHRQQWLPVDPPRPEQMRIGDILSSNASGPRRFGLGTIRDYVLGLTIVLPSGEVIRPGGKVVKNVAGYDLAKLFIGARGSLGVIVDATFKLKPIPETESFVQASFEELDRASAFIETIIESPLDPLVLDLHNVPPLGPHGQCPYTIVLAFAGVFEDVEYQLGIARSLGASVATDLEYYRIFCENLQRVSRRSVLPSELVNAIRALGPATFVARAGNGLIEYVGAPAENEVPNRPWLDLQCGVKQSYDPRHLLPEFPL